MNCDLKENHTKEICLEENYLYETYKDSSMELFLYELFFHKELTSQVPLNSLATNK